MKIVVTAFPVMILLVVAALSAEAQWPLGKGLQGQLKPAAPPSNLTVSGRYQAFISPNIKGHTFMLDSESGKMWIFKKDHSTGDFFLKRIRVDQVDPAEDKSKETEESKKD